MPQISIEYSANLGVAFSAGRLARRVHDRLVEFADAELTNCKTRLIEHKVLIGDGQTAAAMVHVDLRILPGRSAGQKQRLGAAVLDDLEQAVQDIAAHDLQLTVEVRELDGANYHKRRLKT